MDDILIREIKENEYKILDEFLYLAIFIPKGEKKPDKAIINNHDLQVYVKDFGKNKDDFCLVSEVNKMIVGACWIRIMNDYGHIDNNTPSLAISLLEEYRNKGIGTMLLKEMINRLKMKNYEKISLSVQKNNYAFKMYLKCGFEIIKETNEEYIMICELDK